MNRFRVRVFSLIALFFACAVGARAQDAPPNVWFQGTRLIFDHAVASQGELMVSTRDAGMRRFLDRLAATVSYQPQQRYVVITAADRRTVVFTLGDQSYTAGGVRAQAPVAPLADGDDAVLPFYALARALYVEPVATPSEIVLQPRIGALDVRTEGGRTTVTVRAAMPLVTTTNAESSERVQLSFAGLGSSLAPAGRAPGTAVDSIGVAVAGSTKVPITTITIQGARGATHRVLASGSPDAYTVVFESARGSVAVNAPPTPPPLAGWTPPPAGAAPGYPQTATTQPAPATAAPLIVAGRATVTGLAIEPAADDALAVRVTLSGAASYAWHRLNDNRWYVDFQNTTLTGPGRDEHPSFGAVQSVRVRQTGSSDAPAVRIAFSTTGQQRIDLAPSESGLVITVSTATTTDVARTGTGRTGGAAVVASAASPDPNASPSDTGGGTSPGWKFGANNGSKIIVLDPGHGGADPGTQHYGLVEKVLTLDIAQRLKTLLVAQGWTVRMTRETDVDPVSAENIAKMRADGKANPDDRAYLQTRCDVANNAGARLFISIHVNSAPIESARGTTVYWYKPQDAPFAQAIEKNVIPLAGTQDDGTRHENFYVVRHTSMPAVLIETAFATNPGDVALLRQPSFLQNVAQGIANGVKAYAGSPSANALSQQQ
ncbi:MAG: cell wall hydrolase/autolysin [Candidatus Eremiobacteraeota bacterium]|nr:cell wall hydrolase/autolysin [Candidatus Eremiobacteraeota bacterium]